MRVLRISVVSGPNLDRLGTREPSIYGPATLSEVHRALEDAARMESAMVVCMQSNHEGDLITAITRSFEDGFDGIVLNAAAYTHTSVALLDAIRASGVPTVEVHLSNIFTREKFRRRSVIAPACIGTISGFGAASYVLGLLGLIAHLRGTVPRGGGRQADSLPPSARPSSRPPAVR
jgi:3-dehydroquinate dehydratase-2